MNCMSSRPSTHNNMNSRKFCLSVSAIAISCALWLRSGPSKYEILTTPYLLGYKCALLSHDTAAAADDDNDDDDDDRWVTLSWYDDCCVPLLCVRCQTWRSPVCSTSLKGSLVRTVYLSGCVLLMRSRCLSRVLEKNIRPWSWSASAACSLENTSDTSSRRENFLQSAPSRSTTS